MKIKNHEKRIRQIEDQLSTARNSDHVLDAAALALCEIARQLARLADAQGAVDPSEAI